VKTSTKLKLFERAAGVKSANSPDLACRILLSEGDDPRMLEAQAILIKSGFKSVELLTSKLLAQKLEQAEKSGSLEAFSQSLYEKRKAKGMSLAQAKQLLREPLYFAGQSLRAGLYDTVVSGAINTTADVIKIGLHCLDLASGIKTISSSFLMILEDGRFVTFADCAVVPAPNEAELAEIAVTSARTHFKLTQETPRVAFLSFSTKGSAQHERVDQVGRALKLAKSLEPSIEMDGELQFDAAFDPAVAARKCKQSSIAGRANVFIFPSLEAGNIAYKIAERMGRATALGPLLQGFSASWHDLSRGCSADDIALVAACGALMQAKG